MSIQIQQTIKPTKLSKTLKFFKIYFAYQLGNQKQIRNVDARFSQHQNEWSVSPQSGELVQFVNQAGWRVGVSGLTLGTAMTRFYFCLARTCSMLALADCIIVTSYDRSLALTKLRITSKEMASIQNQTFHQQNKRRNVLFFAFRDFKAKLKMQKDDS